MLTSPAMLSVCLFRCFPAAIFPDGDPSWNPNVLSGSFYWSVHVSWRY